MKRLRELRSHYSTRKNKCLDIACGAAHSLFLMSACMLACACTCTCTCTIVVPAHLFVTPRRESEGIVLLVDRSAGLW